MKILQVHNAYQYRGGEDAVVAAEADLLRAHGHDVLEFRRHNDEISNLGKLRVVAGTWWSRRSHAELIELARDLRPDVLHAHNTFPLISPSLFWAAEQVELPVVQTLHNFRLLCPQAMLLREGRVCEQCVGGSPWPAVVHGCYRGSRAGSAVLAGMLTLHRTLGTWREKVDSYIALNQFCRDKFIQGGLPADRIVVKPNFVVPNTHVGLERDGLLFVGRLSKEKGVDVLAQAAAALPPGALKVVGTGPDSEALAACAGVHMQGFLNPAAVSEAMSRAVALVFPSLWYETFGLVLVEAFAAGTPVIASRLGSAAELVSDGVNGLLVTPGDADELRTKLLWALAHPEEMAAMGARAREQYLRHYTPESNYQQLQAVYHSAIKFSRARLAHLST